jgi:uncharacterized membrane protein YuzA (DUF378 family)
MLGALDAGVIALFRHGSVSLIFGPNAIRLFSRVA